MSTTDISAPKNLSLAHQAFQLAMAALLACAFPLAAAQPASQPPASQAQSAPSYNDFRIIPDRNIFNPNRYLRAVGNVRRDPQRTVRADTMTLTGVITYEKGTFAFFEGSRPEYKKVAKINDTVGDMRVAKVTPSSVTLVTGTNSLELPVGFQLRKQEDGPWTPGGRVETVIASNDSYASRGFERGGRFDRSSRDQPPGPSTNPPDMGQNTPDVLQMIEGAVRNVLGDNPPIPPDGMPGGPAAPGGPGGPGNPGAPGDQSAPDSQPSAAPANSGSQPASGPAGAQPANGSNSDDILTILMKRREQELNK